MDHRDWSDFLRDMQRVDDRDIHDDARAWANVETGVTAMPDNIGEWQASLEMAFHAGMAWATRKQERSRPRRALSGEVSGG